MSLCRVCGHHHEEGVKCSICGHVGKCKVLQLLKNKDPINKLSFISFKVDVNSNPILGNWSFSRLLRETIFVRPFPARKSSDEFDNMDVNGNCKHVITFVGDAPIGTARWMFAYDNGVEVAIIEKLGIIEKRRSMSYGWKMLDYIIQDISKTMTAEGRSVYAIVANVINDSSHPAWKTFIKCKFEPKGGVFMFQDALCVKMILLHN